MKKILALLAMTLMLSACDEVKNGLKNQIQGYRDKTGYISIDFYTDPTTKVQYVLYCASYGCSITPRLNPDGTLYIKED